MWLVDRAFVPRPLLRISYCLYRMSVDLLNRFNPRRDEGLRNVALHDFVEVDDCGWVVAIMTIIIVYLVQFGIAAVLLLAYIIDLFLRLQQ